MSDDPLGRCLKRREWTAGSGQLTGSDAAWLFVGALLATGPLIFQLPMLTAVLGLLVIMLALTPKVIGRRAEEPLTVEVREQGMRIRRVRQRIDLPWTAVKAARVTVNGFVLSTATGSVSIRSLPDTGPVVELLRGVPPRHFGRWALWSAGIPVYPPAPIGGAPWPLDSKHWEVVSVLPPTGKTKSLPRHPRQRLLCSPTMPLESTGTAAGPLGSCVRTLALPRAVDYFLRWNLVGMVAFGAFFFAVSIPAWFANVPLPHPIVGLWIFGYGLWLALAGWENNASLVVELREGGIRIHRTEGVLDIRWSDIVQVESTESTLLLTTTEGPVSIRFWPETKALVRFLKDHLTFIDATSRFVRLSSDFRWQVTGTVPERAPQ